MDADMKAAALWYAEHSIPVFPVRWPIGNRCSCGNPDCGNNAGKHPLTEHGFLDATMDPARVTECWEKWPLANIGMPTGKASGFIVLDTDPRNGGPKDRAELIEQYGPVPETAEDETGGGGRHYFFKWAGGKAPPNIGPGIDLKADGGYVLMAPSLHISGKRYEFDGIEGVKALLHPASVPGWLLERIRAGNRNGRPAAPPEGKIPKGKQHNFLVRLAGTMRNAGAEFAEIFDALKTANKNRCTEPGPEANIRKIAESICKYPAGKIYLAPEEPERGNITPDDVPTPAPVRLVSGEEILKMSLPKTDFAVDPIISRPGLWLVNGSQKAGKTILAAQIALSLQAQEPLMGWYTVPRPCGALFIEQDDPSGVAALQLILQRTKIPLRKDRFFSVEKAHFTIEPGFMAFLEHEIAEHDLGVVVLDSYTAMRGAHNSGTDIVKAESLDLGMLDALAKRTGCLIIVIHHASKGSAGLDWSDKSAGTYAMGAHSEGQIFISRFADLPSNAPERLVQIRGRHVDGTEMVIRFDVETLSYSFVLEGSASSLYPVIHQIKTAFGAEAFTPKTLFQELGMPHTTAHRIIGKLIAGGAVRKKGYGEYCLTGGA